MAAAAIGVGGADVRAGTQNADLSISKSDGLTTAVPGQTLTYTILVANAGPSNVGATVTDTFPATLTNVSWTCTPSGPTAACAVSGVGDINDPITLFVGTTVTYTVTATLAPSATGTLVNTATVTFVGDPNTANNSATDVDTITPEADLSITKTDGVTNVVAGGSTTYTITASNGGPSDAPGSTVTDVFPSSLTATWTCVGAGGGTCTAAGSGNISDTVNLPAGGSVTYTVSAAISPFAILMLSNTATVAAPAGVTDPIPANNSATDTDMIAPSFLLADLSITKTDNVTEVTAGTSTTYTIVASNAGPSAVPGAHVVDTFPPGVTVDWTCSGAGGGVCNPAGSGALDELVTLPAAGSVTFTVTVSVPADAVDPFVNVVTIAAPAPVIDPVEANNTATDADTLVIPPPTTTSTTTSTTTTTSAPTTTTPAPTTSQAAVPPTPTTVAPAATASLPATGSSGTVRLASWGLALVALGAIGVGVAARRATRHA